MKSKIYLDANVFVYFIEGEPSVALPLRELFDAFRQKPFRAVTSELTLAETLAPPRRRETAPLDVKHQKYLELLVRSQFIQLEPVSREILIETAELRQALGHKLADAIHIVSATHSQCGYFVSGDADAKRLPGDMKWITPDEQGVRTILAILDG